MAQKWNTRKEGVSLVYEFFADKETPKIAIIRDRASGHAVVYKLVEMNADDIQAAFDEVAKGSETFKDEHQEIPDHPGTV